MTEPKHTQDLDGNGEPDYSAAVPPSVRTVVYISALIVNVVVLVYFGTAVIWGWLPGEQAARTEALLLGALGTLVSGLGVAYRPTRSLNG